jgi:AcrR family transcriptional regulator
VKMRVEAPALPARRTQRERRESTRRRLLDATIDVIYERGFSSATTATIAKRAGVTRGAIFHHFGTRGGLLLGILEDFRSDPSIRLPGDAAAGPGSAGRLERLLEHCWEIFSSRRFIAVVQIQLGTIHDPASYPEVLRSMEQSATEFDRGWVAIFAGHDLAPDRVIAARDVALAAFRGLAVQQVYSRKRSGCEAERTLLKEMLSHALMPARCSARASDVVG